MKRLFATFAVLGVVVLLAAPVVAQTKTITGETVTKTVTVEAINPGTRELTIKGPDGKVRDVHRLSRGETIRSAEGRGHDHRQGTTRTSSSG